MSFDKANKAVAEYLEGESKRAFGNDRKKWFSPAESVEKIIGLADSSAENDEWKKEIKRGKNVNRIIGFRSQVSFLASLRNALREQYAAGSTARTRSSLDNRRFAPMEKNMAAAEMRRTREIMKSEGEKKL